ncbi:MAG: hypothetical protein Q8M03_11950 [Legionella sp.]|nr:hypothetical protein [Legionella sp.]
MGINEFFQNYGPAINGITNIFIALGTVGAVITALYLSSKDSKPKLKVYADVGVLIPDMTENLRISCINIGKQTVICTGFSFAPHIKKPKRIMPLNCIEHLSNPLPYRLEYSAKLDRCHDQSFFSDQNLAKLLSQHEWLARIELKLFWRIIAHTNVGNFSEKLPTVVIDKILSSLFPSNP